MMLLPVLLLLSLGLPAYAGRPYEPTLVDPASVCPAAPPTPGMIQVMGRAKGWKMQVAMDAAREDGVQQMLAYATGYGESAREAVQRNTLPVQGAGTFQRGVACVPMALLREYQQHLERSGKDLDDQIRKIAAELAGAAKGRVVNLLPVTWGDSGAVSQVGDSIRDLLQGSFGANDGVRFLDGPWRPDAVPLKIQLTASGDQFTGSVQLDGFPLGGLRFPRDLFKITPGEEGDTVPEASVSVGGADRLGTNGLSVFVAPPDPDGMPCEGDIVELVANTDRPARVRLYSVTADGTTYLMWPPAPDRQSVNVPKGGGPTGDQVDGALRLPGTTMIPAADRRDERMVLVAVPPGASFGVAENWGGFCKVPGGFSERTLLPPGAAVSSTSFQVRRAEATGCALTEAVESARVLEATKIVDQAQPCK